MARDCNDEVPIFLKLIYLKISPNPGISLVRTLTASGLNRDQSIQFLQLKLLHVGLLILYFF